MSSTRQRLWLGWQVFVPFLGDFFSIVCVMDIRVVTDVFVPFLGDFFSIRREKDRWAEIRTVFVPFLGDFFSIRVRPPRLRNSKNSVFVPFLGDFFSIGKIYKDRGTDTHGFRPLSRGLFFNSVPAKSQPVCSRERIRGGDGWVASSGTLLRR